MGQVNSIAELLKYEYENNIRNGLYDHTQIQMSYHSNRIEGSTLSLNDTATLYDTRTISPKNTVRLQDINDSEGHFLMFETFVKHIDEPLSEEMILSFHGALKQYSVYDHEKEYNIGGYKLLSNTIGGIITTVPPEEVEEEIGKWLKLYHDRKEFGHTYDSLARSHYVFEHIHPFQDGNGRVGRMILFKQCIENNLVPCVITEDIAVEYKDCMMGISTGTDDYKSLGKILKDSAKRYQQDIQSFVDSYDKALGTGKLEKVNKDIRNRQYFQ